MYTGHQSSLEHSNYCSALIGKIWSHKQSPELRDRGKSPSKNKIQSESTQKSETEKGKEKNELISITNKLKRVTCTLPLVLQSDEAYGAGEKSCEICSTTREKYKSDLQAAKVVGILVDSVVEREQIEKIDGDDEEEEINEGSNKPSKDKGRGEKLSFNFSIYCEGDVIKHNLKCVLIKLQKTIGEIMVQVCFVKTRKLGMEDKYRKFNILTSDLKLLKYEYTNLTDAIIPLFKKPSSNKKTNSEVCVPCVKEKLCEHSTRLREILKSGRNLQVVMRNEGVNQGTDKCCYRTYSHVHADVQGKPIVLKYSMPFKVQSSSKPSRTSNDLFETDQSENDDLPQKISSKKDKPQSRQEVPYYEWPEDFLNQQEDFKNPDQDNSSQVVENPRNSTKSRSLGTVENDAPESELQAPQALSGTDSQSRDFSTPQTKSETSIPSRSSNKLPVTPKSSHTSSESKRSVSISSSTANRSQKSNNSQSSSPLRPGASAQVLPAVLPVQSLSSTSSKPSSQSKLDTSEESNSSEVESKSAQSKNSSPSSLYCGCNYDKAYKKLGYQPNTQQNPAKIISQDSLYSESSSSESQLSSFSEGLEKNKKPRDSFANKPNSTTAFPVVTTQPSTLMFSQHSSKTNKKSYTNFNEGQNFLHEANKGGRSPFGAETDNIGVYAAKVDSLVLTKERLSHGGGLSKSSVKINISPEDKAVADAFKPFIDEPKYVLRNISTTEDSCSTTNPHHSSLNQQTNKMEILNYLGRENLLSLCCPAECCKTNSFLEAKGSKTELPYSPSLYSLPLDHKDIEYLSKATGKPVSYEDILLLAEEEIQAKDNEWEIQYSKETNCQNKPKWLRAFNEMDTQKESCGNVSNSQSNALTVRRGSLKSVIIKEEPRLSTIVEEGPICFSDDERPSIPYMPSIPSLPLDEEEKAELIRKHRPSILKHPTMELRYFTVEFTENVEKNIKKEQLHAREVEKFNEKHLKRSDAKTMDKAEKIVATSKSEGEIISCDSSHSCSSSTGPMSLNCERIEVNSTTLSEEELRRNYVEKITMLNAIHLCNISYDHFSDLSSHLNPLRTTFHNSTKHENLHHNGIDKSEHFCLSEMKKQLNDIGFVPEINDYYVKNLILGKNRTQNSKKNTSYTVVQNPKYSVSCCANMDCIARDKKEKIVYRAEFPVNSPAMIKPKDVHPTVYTTVRDISQTKNSKSNLNEKINIYKPKIFYTIERNKDTVTKTCKENLSKKKHITINYSEKQMLPSNHYYKNCEAKTNNSSQCNLHTLSNCTKLKLENLNTNNYNDDQKNAEQEINKSKNNNEPKISYPLTKNTDKERNICKDDFTQKRHIRKNHFEKRILSSSNNCTEKFEMKTNNLFQCNKHKFSNWDKLKLENSNVKNYIADQQLFKQKINAQETKLKQLKDFNRKQMLLSLSHSMYRRMEFTVTLPRIYFPTIHLICINDIIPLVLLIPNKFQRKSYSFEENLRFKTLNSFEKTHKSPSEEKISRNIKNPIFVQTCQEINKVCSLQHNNEDKVLFSKKNVDMQTFYQSKNKRISMNATTETIYPHKSAFEIQTDVNECGFYRLDIESKNNTKCLQANEDDFQKGKNVLFDEDNNPVYLFDKHGRPLTDQSGRILQNIKGDSLIILDEKQNPICDLDNNPIHDSLGHVFNTTRFKSVKPLTEDISTSFMRDSGEPILLYDIDGRPLTSVSGTTLVDCSGKCLIRFGCVNNKISDHIGRPIFSSTGEQFNGFA